MDIFNDFYSFIGKVDLGDAGNWLTGVGTILLAYIAAVGVHSWKHPTKTNIQIRYLDNLVEAVDRYCTGLTDPLWSLDLILIYMTCVEKDDSYPAEYTKYISFVNKHGSEIGEPLKKQIEALESAKSSLNLLCVKGKIHDLNGFEECQESCKSLLGVAERMNGIAYAIGVGHRDWTMESALKHIERTLSFDIKEFYAVREEQKLKIEEYAQKEYKRLLG